MNGFTKLTAIFLLTAAMLAPGAAQAMTFPEFDNMKAQDRLDYQDFMVKCAEQVLADQGRVADATKVHRLFSEFNRPGDKLTLGEDGLEANLDAARVTDLKRIVRDPNAKRVQVEAALIGTLDKNGIVLSPEFVKAFVQLTRTFKPKSSQTQH